MTAEVLRLAADLMRERADAATPSADPQPGGWLGFSDDIGAGRAPSPSDVEHISSWHPTLALAVADWLTEVAALCEALTLMGVRPTHPTAEAVARAYLGEAPR